MSNSPAPIEASTFAAISELSELNRSTFKSSAFGQSALMLTESNELCVHNTIEAIRICLFLVSGFSRCSPSSFHYYFRVISLLRLNSIQNQIATLHWIFHVNSDKQYKKLVSELTHLMMNIMHSHKHIDELLSNMTLKAL